MDYYITNGHNFLNQSTNGVVPASLAMNNEQLGRWTSAEKATHVYQKSKIAQTNGMRVISEDTLKALLKVHQQASDCSGNHTKTSKPTLSSEEKEKLKQMDFLTFGKKFAEIASQLQKAAEYYAAEVSREDQIQQDLLHKIEFGDFSEMQGYAYMRLLRSCRLKRRKAKDNLFAVQRIQSHVKDVSVLQKELEGMENRKYQPRVLKQLF